MGPDLVMDMKVGKARIIHRDPNSPWLEIEVPDGTICIWLETGAVYKEGPDGAVEDDPIKLENPPTVPGPIMDNSFNLMS